MTTNLFCHAPLPPTVRRINKSINERLDRYILSEKLRQAQELRVASQPKPVPQAIYTQQDFIDQLDPQPQPVPQPTHGWRVITEYPTYEVSTDGQVRNSGTGRVLKPVPIGGGYLSVRLYKDNKGHTKKIHRLT